MARLEPMRIVPGDPVRTQCDVDALAYIFAWALEGEDPQPPGPGSYQCSE